MDEVKDKNVIYVEDDKTLANMFASVFESMGIKIDLAFDGEAALKMMKNKYYDVVLLDLMLPRLSGFGVMEKLDQDNIKYGKIIILTNLSSRVDAQKALKMGAEEYLLKPMFSPRQVGKKVIGLL